MHDLLLYGLMILAAYRLTRLVIKDTFPPVLWLRDNLAGGWRKPTEAEWKLIRTPGHTPDYSSRSQITEVNGETQVWIERAKWSPDWLAELITCPWCASAYVSGAVVLATDVTVGVSLPWLAGLAVWAGAALIASRETA